MKNIVNKQIAALSRATVVASLLAASLLATSCEKGAGDELQLPAAAGEIQGPEEVIDGQSIVLSVDEIEFAETYKWFKDGEVKQNNAGRELEVMEAGVYTVAGVNEKGQGVSSANHVVTLKVLNLPGKPGNIRGPQEFVSGATIELSITSVEGAVGYTWYRDGVEVQEGYYVSLTVTKGGTYTVEAYNNDGEGPLSNEHVVTEIVPTTVPAAAGTISGDTSGVEGRAVTLTIGKIENAATYRWYKDGVEVQNGESLTYGAVESGTYTVAGVNKIGEGQASEGHTVTFGGMTVGTNQFSYRGEAFDIQTLQTQVYYYAQFQEYNIFIWDMSARKKIELDGLPAGETANIKDRGYYVVRYWEDTHLGEQYPTQEDTVDVQGNMNSGAFKLTVDVESAYKSMQLEGTVKYQDGGREIELLINYDGPIIYEVR